MRRLVCLLVIAALAGCSNAPIAGFLDCFPNKGGRGPAPNTAPVPAPRPDGLPPPADIPVGPRP